MGSDCHRSSTGTNTVGAPVCRPGRLSFHSQGKVRFVTMEKGMVIRTGIGATLDSFESPATNFTKERTKIVVVKVTGQDVACEFLGMFDAKGGSVFAPRDDVG